MNEPLALFASYASAAPRAEFRNRNREQELGRNRRDMAALLSCLEAI